METIEIIKGVIEIVAIIVGLSGGGIGFYFWSENKAFKKAEVKEKEAYVIDQQQQTWSKQNDEYQEYIRLLKQDIEDLKKEKTEAEKKEREARKAMEDMRATLNDVVKRVGILEVQVERAESFRCERLACVQRIPPLKGASVVITSKPSKTRDK